MSKRLRPLADNVLVKRVQTETVTTGGIHVPETSQGKTQTGEVIAVGEGKLLSDGSTRELKVCEGDLVVFGKYSGTDIDVDSNEFLMLKESDLLGIIEKSI